MAENSPEIDFDNPYWGRAVSGIGEGWQPILLGLDRKLRAVAPGFEYAQVKEKYGGLCVYLDFDEAVPRDTRDQAHALVIEAMGEAALLQLSVGVPVKRWVWSGSTRRAA